MDCARCAGTSVFRCRLRERDLARSTHDCGETDGIVALRFRGNDGSCGMPRVRLLVTLESLAPKCLVAHISLEAKTR